MKIINNDTNTNKTSIDNELELLISEAEERYGADFFELIEQAIYGSENYNDSDVDIYKYSLKINTIGSFNAC